MRQHAQVLPQGGQERLFGGFELIDAWQQIFHQEGAVRVRVADHDDGGVCAHELHQSVDLRRTLAIAHSAGDRGGLALRPHRHGQRRRSQKGTGDLDELLSHCGRRCHLIHIAG